MVLLQGKYAGRKAVIVKAFEDGQGDRKFSHAIGEFRATWQRLRCFVLQQQRGSAVPTML